MPEARPSLVVFSSLFPHPGRKGAGLFIRERMYRVGRFLPLTVVSPQPWSPFDRMIRRLRPHYRPPAPRVFRDGDIEVFCPRFFSLPGILKWLDGWNMASASRGVLARLQAQGRLDLLDAHFAFPDGFAATRLARRLAVPVTITLRGTEPRVAGYTLRGRLQRRALRAASHVIAVADSLAQLARHEGVPTTRLEVVGNGVDSAKFAPLDRSAARESLGIAPGPPVLVTVGGLVERKGFHRVIELLPQLRARFPGLLYLVVGGPCPEGDWSTRLRDLAAELRVVENVRFLGALPPDELKTPLSAADLFVLSTRNEGWANVLLEAMACGLPAVATDVGGNREVICRDELGQVVPFGDAEALRQAIEQALLKRWDREAILRYARANDWGGRVATLVALFSRLAPGSAVR